MQLYRKIAVPTYLLKSPCRMSGSLLPKSKRLKRALTKRFLIRTHYAGFAEYIVNDSLHDIGSCTPPNVYFLRQLLDLRRKLLAKTLGKPTAERGYYLLNSYITAKKPHLNSNLLELRKLLHNCVTGRD